MAAAFQKTKYDKFNVPNHSWQHQPLENTGQGTGANSTNKSWPARVSTLPNFKGCQIQVKPYLWHLGEGGWLNAPHLVVPAGQSRSCDPAPTPACAAQLHWGHLIPLCTLVLHTGTQLGMTRVGTVPQLEEHSRNPVIIFLLEPALQLCHSSSFPVTLVAFLRLMMQ